MLGQPLLVTNGLPERAFYYKLSSSPLRYILLTNAPPEHGYYAAAITPRFTLFREGSEVGTYSLPI